MSMAQKEANIWYFGNKAGIDFNTSPPTALSDGQMNTLEGCASIADKNGELLFYTDGSYIWNRDHKIMPNGTGLYGNNSSAQSSMIVALPGSNQIYYVFTADGGSGRSLGYYYSIVDMSLNSGKGDVTTKNIKLVDRSRHEGVNAVLHSNNRDIWVVFRHPNKGVFSYLLTPSGLEKPILTQIGPDLSIGLNKIRFIIKSSPDGKYIVMGSYNHWTLYRFDNTKGVLKDAITFSNDNNYGFEFSPNSQILYQSGQFHRINQYSLAHFDKDSILNSKISMYLNRGWNHGSLQLGPDLKIYVSRDRSSFLDVIHKPNQLGIGCEFMFEDFDLQSGTARFGLPNFIQSNFSRGVYFSNNCFGDSTEFSPAIPTHLAYDSLQWFFNDNSSLDNISYSENPKHKFSSIGIYRIRLILYKDSESDTIYHDVNVVELPKFKLIEDTLMCSGSKINLHPLDGQYLDHSWWSSGDVNDITIIEETGSYTFTATNDCGTYSDSVFVEFLNLPRLSLRADTSVCYLNNTGSVELFALKHDDYINPIWSTGEITDTITVSQSGTYTLTDNNMCGSNTDWVEITFNDCESYIDMPNVFTPNGDGFNDVFMPIEMNEIKDANIHIFNRWGERVYKSSNLNSGWNGKLNGKLLPESTYFWIVHFETFKGKEQQLNGIVDLIH